MRYLNMFFFRSLLAAVLFACSYAHADTVGDWNVLALSTVNASRRQRGYEESRVLVMVNMAMSEAINFNEAGRPSRFLVTPARPLEASSEAAAAAAAHHVLVQLYPEQKASLDAALGRSLALVPDEGKRESGRIMGIALGMNIYAILSSDTGIGAGERRTRVAAARP